MHTYRIWFKDGSCVLVDAKDKPEIAHELHRMRDAGQIYSDPETDIKEIEELN